MPDTPSSRRKSSDDATVEDQIKIIREDIAELGKIVSKLGASTADSYAARAGRASGELVETSTAAIERAKAQATRLEGELESKIRANPLQSIGIAAGIGFLFALFSKR